MKRVFLAALVVALLAVGGRKVVSLVRSYRRPAPTWEHNFAAYATFNGSWAPVARVAEKDFDAWQIAKALIARQPLVVTGLNFTNWSFERLDELCGDMQVEFKNHWHKPLKVIASIPPLRALFDAIVRPRRNVATLIALLEKNWTLSGYLAHAREVEAAEGVPLYGGIGSYFWPLTIHSVVLNPRRCLELHKEFAQVMQGDAIKTFRAVGEETNVSPWQLFMASGGTRSYPLHQHGNLNENFVTVLNGGKRVWIFPPSEDHLLSERPELQFSEYADRVFMANPEERPGVRGAFTTIVPGEMLYLPSNCIHMLENVGDTVSLHEHLTPFTNDYIEERVLSKSRTRAAWRPAYLRPWLVRLATSLAEGSVIADR